MRAISKIAPSPRAAEDARRCRSNRRSRAPASDAAAPDDRHPRHRALEGQRDIALSRRLDQRRAARGVRLARILLVAGQHHDHLAAGEQSLRGKRPQRLDDHHVAALHVGDAAAGSALASRRNGSPSRTVSRWPINRRRGPRAPSGAAPVLGDKMPGAADLRRQLDPARRETQPRELGGEDRADLRARRRGSRSRSADRRRAAGARRRASRLASTRATRRCSTALRPSPASGEEAPATAVRTTASATREPRDRWRIPTSPPA